MILRGLTSRIILAFVALAVALLLAVSATLFLVLRDLHETSIKTTLGYEVVGIEASFVRQPGVTLAGQIEQLVQGSSSTITDDGGFILVQGPKGAVRVLAGNPSSTEMPPGPTGGAKNAIGKLKTSDGQTFVYIEPNPAGTRNLTFVFAVPDRSGQQALSDLSRVLLILVVVLLLVGVPIAWLLSRSMTGPMRRLAQAAADLPTRSGDSQPLPLEGPTEVRALTERFNDMAHELASTRHEETQMLASLRHDLRTPLTSIAGFAEAIADGTASGDRATSAARTIAEEAQRLERLVGELGVVERLREGPAALRPEELDATALLRDAAARFEGQAAGQGVSFDVGGAAPGEAGLSFSGDRLATERILQNLVVNALGPAQRRSRLAARVSASASRETARDLAERDRRRPRLPAGDDREGLRALLPSRSFAQWQWRRPRPGHRPRAGESSWRRGLGRERRPARGESVGAHANRARAAHRAEQGDGCWGVAAAARPGRPPSQARSPAPLSFPE